MTASTTRSAFGSQLRWWRSVRRFSQLELAARADISSRHLSFLETGRSNPSREMVTHLAAVLDLPLRDGNRLLDSAGFAPVHSEYDLDAEEMAGIRAVLSTLLEAHQPNPALVVDRLGTVVDANEPAGRLMDILVGSDSAALSPEPNINRLTFHPAGIRHRVLNWDVVASSMLIRLRRERDHRPADIALGDLVDEIVAYPGVDDLVSTGPRSISSHLVVPMVIDVGSQPGHTSGDVVSLLTTISVLGLPNDVTVDELRLESFFPADPASRPIVESWAGRS